MSICIDCKVQKLLQKDGSVRNMSDKDLILAHRNVTELVAKDNGKMPLELSIYYLASQSDLIEEIERRGLRTL